MSWLRSRESTFSGDMGPRSEVFRESEVGTKKRLGVYENFPQNNGYEWSSKPSDGGPSKEDDGKRV
jgi:hypothetical protein